MFSTKTSEMEVLRKIRKFHPIFQSGNVQKTHWKWCVHWKCPYREIKKKFRILHGEVDVGFIKLTQAFLYPINRWIWLPIIFFSCSFGRSCISNFMTNFIFFISLYLWQSAKNSFNESWPSVQMENTSSIKCTVKTCCLERKAVLFVAESQ